MKMLLYYKHNYRKKEKKLQLFKPIKAKLECNFLQNKHQKQLKILKHMPKRAIMMA